MNERYRLACYDVLRAHFFGCGVLWISKAVDELWNLESVASVSVNEDGKKKNAAA